MSTSRHPVAHRLERLVGGDERLLATVMGLPLVDGLFPALVLAGALEDPVGIVELGLLVFGGSATLAVVLAEMEGSPRSRARTVLLVGAGVVAVAAVETALAPTIESVLDVAVFERFAAVVVAAIAAKTASARVGEYLPSPGTIVGFGLVASLRPAGAALAVTADPTTVLRGVAAALVGVGFALGVALAGPHLRDRVDLDRFRFGSAVALGLLALSILGVGSEGAPLAVVAVTALLAYDPGAGPDGDPAPAPDGTEAGPDGDAAGAGADPEGNRPGTDAGASPPNADAAVATDGGRPEGFDVGAGTGTGED